MKDKHLLDYIKKTNLSDLNAYPALKKAVMRAAQEAKNRGLELPDSFDEKHNSTQSCLDEARTFLGYTQIKNNLSEAVAQKSLGSLTKVMLSMGASYGEINAVRERLGSDAVSGILLDIVTTLAENTSAFNSFVSAYKKSDLNESAPSDIVYGVRSLRSGESVPRVGEPVTIINFKSWGAVDPGETFTGVWKNSAIDASGEKKLVVTRLEYSDPPFPRITTQPFITYNTVTKKLNGLTKFDVVSK
jgi:hypothetical protein